MLAVHWSRVSDVLSQTGNLSGKVILSCTLPMNAGDTELVMGLTWSGAEELARMTPGARIVSAFNTAPGEVLFGVFQARRQKVKPSFAHCGDDAASKDAAAALIHDVGLRPWRRGLFKHRPLTEPFARLQALLSGCSPW